MATSYIKKVQVGNTTYDIDASKVNGKTVETNVPSEAVFTDTTYTVTTETWTFTLEDNSTVTKTIVTAVTPNNS